jgi:hypothetical protein
MQGFKGISLAIQKLAAAQASLMLDDLDAGSGGRLELTQQ